MPLKSNELFREVSVLSQRVAGKDKFLASTSCMSNEYREIIGYIRAFKALYQDDAFDKYIEALEYIGKANWGRTELTDLGLKLGENIKRGSLRDLDLE